MPTPDQRCYNQSFEPESIRPHHQHLIHCAYNNPDYRTALPDKCLKKESIQMVIV